MCAEIGDRRIAREGGRGERKGMGFETIEEAAAVEPGYSHPGMERGDLGRRQSSLGHGLGPGVFNGLKCLGRPAGPLAGPASPPPRTSPAADTSRARVCVPPPSMPRYISITHSDSVRNDD